MCICESGHMRRCRLVYACARSAFFRRRIHSNVACQKMDIEDEYQDVCRHSNGHRARGIRAGRCRVRQYGQPRGARPGTSRKSSILTRRARATTALPAGGRVMQIATGRPILAPPAAWNVPKNAAPNRLTSIPSPEGNTIGTISFLVMMVIGITVKTGPRGNHAGGGRSTDSD